MTNNETDSVGLRIKKAREEKGLGVQELADKAGCSDEYLSWVEACQVEPPVALLIQLAKAMKMDSGTFLKTAGSPDRRLEEATKRTEHYVYKTLTPPGEDTHLMAFSVTIPPKTPHEGVGYQHEGEEFVYVVSGEVKLIVEHDEMRLGEKESLRFNSNLDHHLSNPGDKEAELLVILYMP